MTARAARPWGPGLGAGRPLLQSEARVSWDAWSTTEAGPRAGGSRGPRSRVPVIMWGLRVTSPRSLRFLICRREW